MLRCDEHYEPTLAELEAMHAENDALSQELYENATHAEGLLKMALHVYGRSAFDIALTNVLNRKN